MFILWRDVMRFNSEIWRDVMRLNAEM